MNGIGKNHVEEAVEAASLYSRAELDHFKLRLAKVVTIWSSRIISGFIGILAVALVLMFLGLAGALYLQNYLSPELAYLSVALAFAVISLVIIAFRKSIIAPLILKSTLQELFDES